MPESGAAGPVALGPECSAALDLPPGWVALESAEHPGQVLFFNELSRASRWEKPARDLRLPSKVKASHILLKHRGSRNPQSRRDGSNVTRSSEEAVAGLREFQRLLRANPGRFAELAKQHSDCSSFKRGGDLGPFSRKQMQPEFEDAAFHLAVNEMSGIVETDSGFHIILRTA
jgi:NIMA-interacting peptidyl-prolyl cis-trans isomerase 1